MDSKLIVSPSPHVRDRVSTSGIMLDVIVALIPALVASTLIFGIKALLLTVTCAASCVFFEYLFQKLCKKDITISDLSAVVTGILLAFNLPVTLPLWMGVFGSLVAIVVVKQLFGGIGHNFANPAITGRIVLMISFTTEMTNWVIPKLSGGVTKLVSGATPLAVMASGQTRQLPSLFEMFLGIRGGCLGETCVLGLVLGGLYLVYKKVITPVIPVAFIGTVLVLAAAVGQNPLYHLMSGGLVLGAIFMATDYTTSPTTTKGKLLFGIGCGVFTFLIRVYGSYPEGVSFAILLMNIITPHIENLTASKPFGGAK